MRIESSRITTSELSRPNHAICAPNTTTASTARSLSQSRRAYLSRQCSVAGRADALEDSGAEYKFVGQITNCVVDDRVASFTFGTRNLQQAPFPRNRWVANHCQWRFGTAECGYEIVAGGTDTIGGGFTFCPRTLPACEERGAE